MNARNLVIFILLLIGLFSAPIASVQAQDRLLDSIEQELHQTQHDTSRLRILSELMYGYLTTQPAKSLTYGLELLELASGPEYAPLRANAYAILGEASFYIEQYQQAEDFFIDQLKTYQNLNDSAGIASALTNLGIVKRHNGNYEDAIDYYRKSSEIKERMGDSAGVSSVYNNIGVLYETLHLPSQAMAYYRRSLRLESKLNNNEGIATSWLNIGALYPTLGHPDSAQYYLLKCISLSDSMGYSIIQEMAHESLANVLKAQEKYKQALIHFEKMHELKSKRIDKEKAQHVAELTQTFRLDQQEATIDKLYKTNQYRTWINYLALTIILITGTLFLLLWRENRKRKQNYKILEKRNKEIWQKNEEIESQRDEIIRTRDQLIKQNSLLENQRELLTKQKKDLTDSLEYARHIQNALMPDAGKMKKLLGNGFYIFLPRDIVSGDFYWGCELGDKQLVVCADATGHGVPGAFLSIIGINFLNEVVHTQEITDPASILWEMRKRMIKLLVYSDKYEEAKDSIDMGIMLIDRKQQELTFAGAYHHLFYIHQGMLQVVRADKMCVGLSMKEMVPFTNHTIQVDPGDTFYLFSDGYPDQFGGERRKKLRIGNFKELLLGYQNYTMEEQKKLLFDYFVSWKKGLPQVDDVLLIGVRI
jgi:serine phosphatase RsbU (regulator of sigma subunit)